MGRRKIEERNIRKLTKLAGGASYGITLPIEYVRELKWRERQKLVVRKVGKRLIIEDWPVRQAQGRPVRQAPLEKTRGRQGRKK